MAEAFDAWRKGRPGVAEELADVAIHLLSLAEMLGIDLQDAVEAKLAKNAARTYEPLPNGTLVKSASPPGPEGPPASLADPGRTGMLPPDVYVASLARKRMAAAALCRDEAGRVLLVDPIYRYTWDLPGVPWRLRSRRRPPADAK
jgi:hypothetical protein